MMGLLFPNPTGRNGYEEYVRAAEIISDHSFNFYLMWTPQTSVDDIDPTDKTGVQLYKHFSNMKVLGVRKELLQKYGLALDLVRQGNMKPVTDPRPVVKPDTVFPELTYFKRIAQLFTAEAYVKFAEGHPSAGTQSLLDGLAFANNISGGSIISSLVGVAMTAIILAACEDRLPAMALDDAKKIQDAAEHILKGPLTIAMSFDVERRSQEVTADWLFTRPNDDIVNMIAASEKDAASGNALVKRIKAATPTDRARWRDKSIAVVEGFYADLQQQLRQPESNWGGLGDQLRLWQSQESDAVVRQLVDLLFPVMDQVIVAITKERTQLRLLALHGKVLEYRWENGRLPKNLSEAAEAGDLGDPLSGEQFVYEPRGSTYRLYSKGSKHTGEIELRYRSRVSTGSDDVNPLQSLRPLPTFTIH